MKKRILCYGDSNTYGYVPAGNGRRYAEDVRWTGRLSSLLGKGYTVIEEGLPGRTADLCGEYPWKEGISYFKASLSTHRPIDMAVIMLGTNDTKRSFQRDSEGIAETVEIIVRETKEFLEEKQNYAPKILLVCPAVLDEAVITGPFGGDFDMRSVKVSRELAKPYQAIAEKYDCLFLDAAQYAVVSTKDGVHLEGQGHKNLAEAVYSVISEWYAAHPDETDQSHMAMIENS